eukprot:scaffold268421_cov31-Tisochrysis_lutea.AAC.2
MELSQSLLEGAPSKGGACRVLAAQRPMPTRIIAMECTTMSAPWTTAEAASESWPSTSPVEAEGAVWPRLVWRQPCACQGASHESKSRALWTPNT